MEGEVGAHVATPIFFQKPVLKASNLAKKRDLPWLTSTVHPNPNPSWNPWQFGWDSVAFSVRPSSDVVGNSKGAIFHKNYEEDGENLTLKLGGGGAVVPEEDPVADKPSKKIRSGSPGVSGSGGGGGRSYLMCQVDDCRADLSNAKDYHRRHKVCEIHNKTTKALVGTQMQRFCQQCSRFHLLSEFDEGKRSCRRRLAEHNRRRMKTQPEEASSRLLPTGNQANNSNGNVDVVKLLGILACLRGTSADIAGSSISGDNVVQDLSKMQSVPTIANNASELPVSGEFDLNVSEAPPQASSKQYPKANGNPSTTNLLTVFPAALATSTPYALAALSQISSDSCGDDKGKVTCKEPVGDNSTHSRSTLSVGTAPNSCTLSSHLDLSKYPVQDVPSSLSLQLFSSPENDMLPKIDSTRKYVPSESSNPVEVRSPSYSPPAAKLFFPLHSVAESKEHGSMSICLQGRDHVGTSTSRGWIAPLDLFKKSERRVRSGGAENLPRQDGCTSSSGSDRSPSTSNSDVQDRTERIIFKLFDKDPRHFPGTLRTQILNWLSNSPSEMESYIRPGCVVLSVYASMPSKAWNEATRA
ncbi:squamosa promoter-binding-like protein 15 [Iris pallida]|uniref:Squamosa promoter-binding-like protein 15 n=1 Tax=Iris pallida TaxID=29817 RepID=A0AAX6GWM1_IRIPA|nr:squamosa promoter-binding-like protein 15 [Iris pallida]KAJ6833129.1 squamosa promoter-binding-like protein 15 [Iris pallida]